MATLHVADELAKDILFCFIHELKGCITSAALIELPYDRGAIAYFELVQFNY